MHTLKEVISEQEIHKRVKELGKEISKVYEGEPLVILCTLKGAFLFFSDLVRSITCPHEIDFVRVASYGNSDTSSTLFLLPRILKSISRENMSSLLKILSIPDLPWNFC